MTEVFCMLLFGVAGDEDVIQVDEDKERHGGCHPSASGMPGRRS